VVVRPIGDLPVLGPNNGRPVQRGFDLSFESAVERLCQGCIKSPFGDHALTDHENRISLEPSVWKGLSRLLEEFSQSLLICKLQSKSVIFEPEFFGKPASASSTLPFFNCDKTVNTTPSEAAFTIAFLLTAVSFCIFPPYDFSRHATFG